MLWNNKLNKQKVLKLSLKLCIIVALLVCLLVLDQSNPSINLNNHNIDNNIKN